MSFDFSNLVKRVKKAKKRKKEVEKKKAEKIEIESGPAKLESDISRGRPAEDVSEPEEEEGYQETKEKVSLTPTVKGPGEWIEKDKDEDKVSDEAKKDIDVEYPLIPEEPAEDERLMAKAHIFYDESSQELMYHLYEPERNEKVEKALKRIKKELKDSIDVDFAQLKKEEAKNYLQEKVEDMLERQNFGLSEEERDVIQYYAYRDFVGLGKIEPLMHDTEIEDISCDGTGIPIYIYHRNPKIGSVKSNIVFEGDENLDKFVRKLAQRCGRSISMAEPLLDGSLPDGSRVQATLSTDIARRGTNFTIRRFTEEPLTPIHLMDYGSISADMLAYLWVCIENGKSVLIPGATAAGKTTLLNALSLFIRPELKIVSIEDTPELRLPHPNWVPEVAREGFGFGEQDTGQVTMDDLLKESLRQRPDYIIVGEVRGEEAYILFQQMATGHPGMSTIHASSLSKVMDRLTTKPIDLPPSLISNIDMLVFTKRVKTQETTLRRVGSVHEFREYDKDQDKPIVNNIFQWDASEDEFDNINDSFLISEIAEEHGRDVEDIQEEIERRKKILNWMLEKDIKHYEEVGRIISTYYQNPDQIVRRVKEEI